jgi:hypothetical protein
MSTLYVIIGLFAVAALGGMYLLALVLQRKETPKFVAFIHGLFAATALILLIVYSSKNPPGFTESIILFVMAALGGFVLIIRDLTGKSIPRWLAVTHGLIAVAGFVVLLFSAFSS